MEQGPPGLTVTRVRRQFVPPMKKRDVVFKIDPCKEKNCVTCEEVNRGFTPAGAGCVSHLSQSVKVEPEAQKVLSHSNVQKSQQGGFKRSAVKGFQKSMQSVDGQVLEDGVLQNETGKDSVVYSVLWAKSSTRKHKIWEGDGYLTIRGKDLTLKNVSGKVLETSRNHKLPEEI
ncbi:unnamed protein product, partial [Allacma fusca]